MLELIQLGYLTDLSAQACGGSYAAHMEAKKAQPLSTNDMADMIEAVGQDLPRAEMPVEHVFTPGLYVRKFRAPAGTIIPTRIHKFEHPFVLLEGEVSVRDEEGNEFVLTAPHFGVTKPGTRRILFTHTDILWVTFHVTNLTDPEEIVRAVTEDYTNPLNGETHEAMMAKQYAPKQLPD